jgi:integration host factor subunit beta
MDKIHLIQTLKDANGHSKSEAEAIVNLFFNTISKAMVNVDRIEIRGFCSFFVKEYENR